MMLHPLDIPGHLVARNAEKKKEIGQDPVTTADGTGNALTLRGEHETPVFFMTNQPLPIESLDPRGDTGLGDPKTSRDINDSCVAFAVDQLLDALEIILDCGG